MTGKGIARLDVTIGAAVLGMAGGVIVAAASGLPAPPSTLSQWGGIAAALLVPIVGWFLRGKLREIHVLVNSNLSRVQSDYADALQRIERLEGVISRLTGIPPDPFKPSPPPPQAPAK